MENVPVYRMKIEAKNSFDTASVVLDLFDRKVVGWAFSDRMDAGATVVAALGMAVKNRPPIPGLIFHSDRGSQYCSHAFREALRAGCRGAHRQFPDAFEARDW